MKYLLLNREESKKEFQKIYLNGIDDDYFDSLNNDYKKIREDILGFVPRPITKNYTFDLKFGIKLYEYFNKNKFPDFNEAIASNYDFWRYICLKVVPDIIIERHGLIANYFYDKNVRIYISTLWWFIEMSYQGSIDKTYNCLERFSTDFILQFVERPGRDGMYISVVRDMFKYLSILPIEIINEKKGNQTLIRRLLIQYTAEHPNFNLVVEGKSDEYVKGLFNLCGVNVDEYGKII